MAAVRITWLLPVLATIALVAVACGAGGDGIIVTSSAFADGKAIPARYSCEDENLSPPLAWRGVPEKTVEVALVVSDPDAPRGTFFHWLVLGIAPGDQTLPEGATPRGAVQAAGSSENATYIGMCPPNGEAHEYEFTVHALDEAIAGRAASKSANAVAALIDEHTIAKGSLTGRFGR